MPRKSQPERDKIIYELHEKGKSFTDLSEMFKINRRAVWEAYWKVASKEGKKPPKSALSFIHR